MEKVDQAKRNEYVQSVCDTIRAGASVVGKMSGTLGGKKDVTQSVLTEAVNTLNQEIAKVGVLCGLGSASAWPETKAMIDAVQQKVLILYSALHSMCCGGGAALKQTGNELANSMIEPLQRLLKLAVIEEVEGDDLNRYAGVVWHTAKAILKIPLTNRSAVSRSMVKKLTAIQDTLQEVQQMGKKRKNVPSKELINGAGGTASGVGEGEGEGEGEDTDELDDFTEDEIELARISAKVMDCSLKALKTIAKKLIQGDDNMVNQENLESWDKVLYLIGDIRKSTEEWGAALYPPQEDEMIQKNMTLIYHRMESLQGLAEKICVSRPLVDMDHLYRLMEDVRLLMNESVHEEEEEEDEEEDQEGNDESKRKAADGKEEAQQAKQETTA